jgi:hypothetical protein
LGTQSPGGGDNKFVGCLLVRIGSEVTSSGLDLLKAGLPVAKQEDAVAHSDDNG